MSNDHRAPGEPPPDGWHGPSTDTDTAADPDHAIDAVRDEDDLEAFRAQRSRRTRRRTRWLAALLAVALVIPTGRWAIDELRFRLSGASVVETLEGERSGAELADTVLLVRAAGCAGGTTSSGSAFVLATPEGPRLVTNRHVVEDTRRVGVRSLDGDLNLEVTDIEVSRVADVAVLHVDDDAVLPPALALSTGSVNPGDEVRLVGFPAARPFTTSGEVAEVGPGRLLLDLQVDRGASGSPVVAEDGRVVGQVFAVTRDGLGVATPAGSLPGALEQLEPPRGC